LVPALWIGAAILAAGSLVSLAIPRKRRADASAVHDRELVARPEAA
jgi:hypothetical protein